MNKPTQPIALLTGLMLSSLIAMSAAQAEPTAQDANSLIKQLIQTGRLNDDMQNACKPKF